MFNSSTARAALACATAALTVAMAAPSFAEDQPPPPGPAYSDGQVQPYYDPCKRDQNNRAVTGAVVGGILGAVVGSSVAAHGVRTEGAVLGGGVGALGGAAIGADSAACRPGQSYPQASYNDNGYRGDSDYRGQDERYDDRYASGAGPGDDGDYDNDADDRGAPGYSGPAGPGANDDCEMARSETYMPDGQVQKRFVRVCRDASGHYQLAE